MDTVRYIILRANGDSRPDRMDGDGVSALSGPEDFSLAVEMLPTSSLADVVRDPNVIAAAPDMPVELISPTASEDPSADDDEEWGIAAVGASSSSFDGAGVKVAVLDTGIDRSHAAFTGIHIEERDFTGEGNGDGNGHGTHCAGTIFGRDIGRRIGVARGIDQVLIGKVLGTGGGGSSGAVLNALRWAEDRGAQIVSMSLGFAPSKLASKLIADGWPKEAALSEALQAYGRNLRLYDALMLSLRARRTEGRQMLVVAATGNDSARSVDPRFRVGASLPSAADDVVSVGAVEPTARGFAVARFSNTMPTLCAPGVGICSAWPGGSLKVLDGTSMAAPHVAGVAALWWQSLGRRASAEIVRSKLIGETDVSRLAPGYDHTDVGFGLVRAP